MIWAGIGVAVFAAAVILGLLLWQVIREDRKRLDEMRHSANADDDGIERWREEWKRRYKL